MPDYAIFGLTVRAPFACPAPEAAAGARPDVTVVEGPVPTSLPDPVVRNAWMEAVPGTFLVRGATVGRFLVDAGDRVVLDRAPGSSEQLVGQWFVHTVVPMVLQRRGMFVLHANSVVVDGGCVAVGGDSGAGKSTTLVALVARGFPMLTDDVTPLRLRPDGVVDVLPGLAETHLTEESAAALDIDISALTLQPWRRMKAAVPLAASAGGPAPLRALYLLETGLVEHVEVRRVRGVAAFDLLYAAAYGPLMDGARDFPVLAAAVRGLTAARVVRPAGRWSVDEVVDAILADAGS